MKISLKIQILFLFFVLSGVIIAAFHYYKYYPNVFYSGIGDCEQFGLLAFRDGFFGGGFFFFIIAVVYCVLIVTIRRLRDKNLNP